MRKSHKLFAALGLLAVLSYTGCRKKEQVAEVDNETQSSVDNAIADQEYMSVVPATQDHAINTKGTGAPKKGLSICDTLTLISGDTLWGKPGHVNPTYTMSVSKAVCAQNMPDARFRTGYVSIKLTDQIKNAGAKMIIKYFNYQAALVSYSCDSMVVTTNDANATFVEFRVQLINGVCQKGNNWTIKYSLDRTIKHYFRGNPSGSDPVTYIYGSASGVNRQGRSFTVSIPEDTRLVKYRSCEYISQGIMTLTPDGFKERTIDYGYSIAPAPHDGCDEDASFTVNGNTVAFKLK